MIIKDKRKKRGITVTIEDKDVCTNGVTLGELYVFLKEQWQAPAPVLFPKIMSEALKEGIKP